MHRFAVPLLLFLGTGCLQPTPLKLGDDSSALVDTAPDTGTPGTSVDKDQDGYPAPEDCDDDDPLTNPGSLEVCDGIDNDCDGGIDNEPVNGSTFFVDEDGDGFGVNSTTIEACELGAGLSEQSGDCDDTDPGTFPGASESCDGVDNNCSGRVDENACEDCIHSPYRGHTYQFCWSPMSWTDARDLCEDWGYALVTINDEDEEEFLDTVISTNEFDDMWIGYNDRGESNEDDFSWTGAPGSDHENWYDNEPNNYGNEDCVEKREEFDHQWNDRRCDQEISFICEGSF